MTESTSNIGLIGLAVMGQNLALNIADHGYKISVFNRTYSKTENFLEKTGSEVINLTGYEDLKSFVDSLERPKKIIIMVQAGNPTDAVIDSLIPLLDKGDIIIDGGNAKWTDTIRREKTLKQEDLFFLGSGVSGGEEGARYGPSLMPGGSKDAWNLVKPIWDSISAKVDASNGKPLEGATPGNPIVGGEPCSAYIGNDGAGHYVKMVHNGI
ncbi:MAG: NADP-dependent phosphogluconate dehydrogenase, partial [Opitutae bacterium]|nr:NADP-dependent phosphogluconate dehydrogenase [Opitutae bacterium]